jgi:sulfatase modifying factor 1
MSYSKWTRRRFLQSSVTAAAVSTTLSGRALFSETMPTSASFTNSLGAHFVRIEPGRFQMGESRPIPAELYSPLSYMTRPELQKMFPNGDPERFVLSDRLFREGDADERPVHSVEISLPVYVASHQVTNLEFEQFQPAHRALRDKFGFSKEDDEAVIYVTWQEATDFCAWLSHKEGLPYRLLTEAEWEYAARANTTTLFSTGDDLPDLYLKNPRVTDFMAESDKVSLQVGQTPPNPWGLFDIHGNVEEWVSDWYGPYPSEPQRNPLGRSAGEFKVTRGGSHGTFAYYLRSANRCGALPDTRGFTIGFRIAMGAPFDPPTLPPPRKPNLNISQHPFEPKPSVVTPFFRGPSKFVKIPEGANGPLFHFHNHDTAIAECPNGDMLAIWYSCAKEQGRELGIASSRLRKGATEWEPALEFWNAPDRNDHCPALWFDGKSTLYHLNGYALSHYWEPLAVILRTSTDSGATWSPARFAVPEFAFRTMVCQRILPLRDGSLLFGADAHPERSAVWVSSDQGKTWSDPGGSINGIHASVVELTDGRLMALGRGGNIDGFMPMSISANGGKSWTVTASTLPPVTYTQRFSMIRLKEGPLFIASFGPNTEHFEHANPTDREMSNLFAALSFDEGKTWTARRLITDDAPDHGVDTISNGRVLMGTNASEPAGYVSACQARDRTIHVLSSINHYAFNMDWIKNGHAIAFKTVSPIALSQRAALGLSLTAEQREALRVGDSHWSAERTGDCDALDSRKGFTVEARVQFAPQATDHFELRIYVRSGATMCSRYWIRVTASHVDYWYKGGWQPIAEAANADAATYRLAVRKDTSVQIYREERLLATFPASYEIGFAPPTRGSFVEWSFSAPDPHYKIESLALDFEGAFAPTV